MVFLHIALDLQAHTEYSKQAFKHHTDSWSSFQLAQMEYHFLGLSRNDLGQPLWVICLPPQPIPVPKPYGTLTNSVSSSPGGHLL